MPVINNSLDQRIRAILLAVASIAKEDHGNNRAPKDFQPGPMIGTFCPDRPEIQTLDTNIRPFLIPNPDTLLTEEELRTNMAAFLQELRGAMQPDSSLSTMIKANFANGSFDLAKIAGAVETYIEKFSIALIDHIIANRRPQTHVQTPAIYVKHPEW